MLLFGITVLSIVIIVAGVSWTLINNLNQSTLTPSPSTGPQASVSDSEPLTSPDFSTSPTSSPSGDETLDTLPTEQVRDAAMAAIKASHSENAPLMTNLTWTGGRADAGSMDNETYLYYSSGWAVTVEYPVTSPITYSITGTYNSDSMFITFSGVYANGAFTTKSYAVQKLVPQST
jgi:hypothetical protein